MKRPVIKDTEVRKYVEYLESKVNAINTQSVKAEAYLSLRKFISDNNKIMKTDITDTEASSKDDKIMDRVFKYADNIEKYLDKLEKIYEGLGETYVEEVDKEAGSIYEKALNGK